MDVSGILKSALKAVDDARIPKELKPVAFAKAVDLLSPSAAPTPQGPGNDKREKSDPTERSGRTRSKVDAGAPGLEKVAAYFNLEPDDLDELFSEHEGALQIAVDTESLGGTTAAQAKAIAVLVIAGRQIGGYDSATTALETVRVECDRHGVYDSGNFSTQMNSLKAFFNVNGEKASRTYKLKPSGRTEAKRIVAELIASGDEA